MSCDGQGHMLVNWQGHFVFSKFKILLLLKINIIGILLQCNMKQMLKYLNLIFMNNYPQLPSRTFQQWLVS